MTVLEYVIEEVTRQGHHTHVFNDGGVRVGWMLAGWEHAFLNRHTIPTVTDAERIGKCVESIQNIGGFRTCGVMVGMRVCPNPREVPRLLVQLWEHVEDMPPIDFYKAFEEIHPFRDGNGRTGKVLLNWLNKTLEKDPIFPPANLWGREIRNP